MITIEIECPSCKGTGLYKGMAERDGAAVICWKCRGTGKTTYSYNEFTGRKEREDVKRVYDGSHGYCITDQDVEDEDGKTIHFSKFGCTYDEWKSGATPKFIEELVCPFLATGQDHGVKKYLPCDEYVGFGGYIPACPNRKHMAECWEKYHENNAE